MFVFLILWNRYFGKKPTSVTSESNVRIGDSAMPWEREDEGGKIYKYQYHPHGDESQGLRAAPSALNTVIVPNVTLPKVSFCIVFTLEICSLSFLSMELIMTFLQELHDMFNKYGKEEWDY